jgi:transcriptional regulator with XRE-family HTH domain
LSDSRKDSPSEESVPNLRDRIFARFLGEEVRKVRHQHGWTMKQLAAQMPSTPEWRTIQSWERGKRNFTVCRLMEIGETLGTSAWVLMQRAEAQTQDPSHRPYYVDVRALAQANDVDETWFEPVRRWAQNHQHATVYVVPETTRELAVAFGLTPPHLASYFAAYRNEEMLGSDERF